MAFDKVRIRFQKTGELRLVSHHDLMRSFERMLRRAQLPFRSTEGFHPQPRVVFALPLSLGIAGLAEVVEIEWTEPVEPDDVLVRLKKQAPLGLLFLSARRIDLKQSAKPRRTVFRIEVPADQVERLTARCAAVMELSELWVDRERPTPRQINVRPYLNSLKCTATHLEMDLWVTPEGSARADELLRTLDLDFLLDTGAVIERTNLVILDEIDPTTVETQPILPTREERMAMVRPLRMPAKEPEAHNMSPNAHWGSTSGAPILE